MAVDATTTWLSNAFRGMDNGVEVSILTPLLRGELGLLAGKACVHGGNLEQARQFSNRSAEHLDGSRVLHSKASA
jgi:hypothetical protein